jgi:release factor glutamine methyltransferase
VTIRQALTRARNILRVNEDLENLNLESEVLLRHVLKIDRAALYLDTSRELDPQKEVEFLKLVERRLRGEPLAYIICNREFYNLDFYVDSRVLIPRPETELIVEKAIQFSKNHSVNTVADIGTGSGAIAVSLAVHLPGVNILATDISTSALEVARMNCLKHGVEKQVTLAEGDLLDSVPGPVDLLTTNLPYVRKTDLFSMSSAKFEPLLALDGGESGLNQILRLCKQLSEKINSGGYVLMEIGQGQGQTVAELLRELFPRSTIKILPDLAGIERVVELKLDDN